MPSIATMIVQPARRVRGRICPPGDKSISHRYALLGALAEGCTVVTGFAPGADCAATLACLEQLGIVIERHASHADELTIHGRGIRGLRAPREPLNARNSGTTMRLLAGILSAHPFSATLVGDPSLSRRPMRRVIEPLEGMGARIGSVDGHPPLTVKGGPLQGIDHSPEISSAQVKSAVLLAGLQAEGTTRVCEPTPTRDHTERALRAFGADVSVAHGVVAIEGGQRLCGTALQVPGDLSSAAFWAAAAAALPGSVIELEGVGLNPTRTAFLDLLARLGADVERRERSVHAGEPQGCIIVRHGGLGAVTVGPREVPALIDELPVLAALATHGGDIEVTGAGELRVKESDRISALVGGLLRLGADAEESRDGFRVRSRGPIPGGAADAAGDHRLAMAFAIAALGARQPCVISGADVVAVSYPGFFQTLESICE